MITLKILRQIFKELPVGDFAEFSRKNRGCPECGAKKLYVRPSYPGCRDMVNILCNKCGLGWGETANNFIKSDPAINDNDLPR